MKTLTAVYLRPSVQINCAMVTWHLRLAAERRGLRGNTGPTRADINRGAHGLEKEGEPPLNPSNMRKQNLALTCLSCLLVAASLGGTAVAQEQAMDENGESVAAPMYDVIRWLRNAKEEAENARVLYVAMTRARERLLLSSAPNRQRGSWLELFDFSYPLHKSRHGDVISGGHR